MIYFTEKGRTDYEVRQAITQKYGGNYQILTQSKILIGGFLGLFQRDGLEYTGFISGKEQQSILRNTEKDQAERNKILEMRKQAPVVKNNDKNMEKILQVVESLKDEIKNVPNNNHSDEIPSIVGIEEFLLENDFSSKYIKSVLKRLKEELTFGELQNYDFVEKTTIDWIGDSIKIHESKKKKNSNVFILVGPTGVGKTTTIAKLAAQKAGVMDGVVKNSVKIITIDNYRIGAREQIKTYGEIMDIPVSSCESYEDLKMEIDDNSDKDYIFVDTIGKSPKDFEKLGEMRRLLEACGHGCEVHLAFSATTKTWDIREIMKQYYSFGYESIIITKLDETTRSGNLISLLKEKEQSISYITTGQMVPQDIEVASKSKIMSLLVGSKQVIRG